MKVKSSGNAAAAFAVAGLSIFAGYNWVAVKIALGSAGVFPFTALRSGGAALVMFAVLLLVRKPLKPPVPLRLLIPFGLVQTTAVMSLISAALVHGNAGKSAILTFTMPFWLLLLAMPVLGERWTCGKAASALLGILGVLFTFSPWARRPDVVPMLLATGAGFFWAVGGLIAKRIPVHGFWELTALTAWQMALGTLPLIVLAVLYPGGGIHPDTGFILAAFYVVVPGTTFAWLLWFFLLNRLPAGVSGLTSLLVPVAGLIAAWAQLGERPSPWEWTGMFLILVALAVLGVVQLRAAHSPPLSRLPKRSI